MYVFITFIANTIVISMMVLMMMMMMAPLPMMIRYDMHADAAISTVGTLSEDH